jgi:ribosomal protein S1
MVPVAIKVYFVNYPILSRRRLNRRELEDDLLNAEETGDEVEVKVVGVIPGGAQVSYKGLPLFLPAGACVDGSPAPEALGTMKTVKVTQYYERGATVSEVAARAGEDKEKLAELKVGQVVSGRITGVAPFGFYVATDTGLKGLLHISQITSAYVRIENIPLAVGDEIKAMVTKVDISQLRLQLGTKELEKKAGDILLDPAKVFETAEEVAKEVTERKEQAKKAIDQELMDLLGEGFDMGNMLE